MTTYEALIEASYLELPQLAGLCKLGVRIFVEGDEIILISPAIVLCGHPHTLEKWIK